MTELYQQYFSIFLYIVGGLLSGLLFEKILLVQLKKLTQKNKWEGDELMIDSFKGLIILSGLAAGAYLAIYQLPYAKKLNPVSDKIIVSIVFFLVTIYIARLLVGIIKLKAAKGDGLMPTSSIIANMTRIAVYVMGALVILQTFGISVTPLLTALGVGGLAVALALQETLSNFFSGIQVIASKQIRPGDYIKLDSGEEGYVTDITWRNTIIRMLSNNLVVVPNSKMASAILTNYHLPDKETAVLIEVGVSYDSDLSKVEKVTTEAAEEVISKTDGTVKSFKPFIRYHTFADSGIEFTVILRAKEFTDQYLIKHEFVKVLYKRYQMNAIDISYPVRIVLLKKANLN